MRSLLGNNPLWMTICVQDIAFEVFQMILKDGDIGPRELPHLVNLNHNFFCKLFFLGRHHIGVRSGCLGLWGDLHNSSCLLLCLWLFG